MRAEAYQCDVGDRDAVFEMVEAVGERFGRIDVLVNSAARGLERPRAGDRLAAEAPASTRWTSTSSARGSPRRPPCKYMNDGGAIINLLSPGSDRYLPKYAPVGVSKGALESLTIYLAVELAPRGIRVNAVSAGLVEGTDGVRMMDSDLVGDYEAKVPAGRHVHPDLGVIGLVVFPFADERIGDYIRHRFSASARSVLSCCSRHAAACRSAASLSRVTVSALVSLNAIAAPYRQAARRVLYGWPPVLSIWSNASNGRCPWCSIRACRA